MRPEALDSRSPTHWRKSGERIAVFILALIMSAAELPTEDRPGTVGDGTLRLHRKTCPFGVVQPEVIGLAAACC